MDNSEQLYEGVVEVQRVSESQSCNSQAEFELGVSGECQDLGREATAKRTGKHQLALSFETMSLA